MRKGLVRACLAATLLCTLVIPAVGSRAGDAEKLEETREKLTEIRDRIDDYQATAGSIEDEVKSLSRDMVELREIIAGLDGQIGRNEIDLRSIQANIDDTQDRIDRISRRAKEQAVALYKSGATDTIDALLDAESLTELDARAEMLGVAAQQNTGVLVRFSHLKVSIEHQHQELFDKQQELEATREQRTAALQELGRVYEQHSAKLAKLEKTIDEEKHHEGELEERAGVLARKIAARQAAAAPVPSVQSFGASGSGFIWPLNGAVNSYFGPRWGRMHTGLDIDGTSGQPIVASKSGRVILSAPYSGYGNAVVIDHDGTVSTLYAHMSSMAVSEGQSVSQGQVIGYVGCTGSCTGDHLHFEVRVNGNPVDPMGYLP